MLSYDHSIRRLLTVGREDHCCHEERSQEQWHTCRLKIVGQRGRDRLQLAALQVGVWLFLLSVLVWLLWSVYCIQKMVSLRIALSRPPVVFSPSPWACRGRRSPRRTCSVRCHFRKYQGSEGKKYTPKVFSALKTQVPQQPKKRFAVYQKLVFKGKRRKIRVHQSAFEMFVGGPFAQYWCIDFGLLKEGSQKREVSLKRRFPPPHLGGAFAPLPSPRPFLLLILLEAPTGVAVRNSFQRKVHPSVKKVRRGHREGDRTENIMTERPSRAHWFCP